MRRFLDNEADLAKEAAGALEITGGGGGGEVVDIGRGGVVVGGWKRPFE